MADVSSNSSGETTKQRTERIDREYYKRSDPFLWWKRTLAIAALLAGIAWCAWGAFDKDRHYSPGPVASAHAMWENNCDACHLPFTPIRGDTWLSSAKARQELDAKCMACHKGPAHHWLQKGEEVAGCASCHADHHGREASLVRMDDAHCTRCHADLNTHRLAGEGVPDSLPADVARITQFDTHHPEFRSAQEDPGRLKFSHQRHMAAGLRATKNDRFKAWTWQDIPEADRPRFNRNHESLNAEVQLDCAACHQFGVSGTSADYRAELPDAVSPQRSAGAYALPIVYEKHCAACHPLAYDPDTSASASDHATPQDTIPHRLPAEKMRAFLEATYARALLKQKTDILQNRIPAAPFPATEHREELKTVAGEVDVKIRRTATFLRGRCAECHEVEDRELTVREGNRKETELWFGVAPTKVPQIWLTKARFDHAAHRAVNCQDCHAKAYRSVSAEGNAPRSLIDHDQVLLPGRETCVRCHAPQRWDGTGGARFDCVECHAYHDLDHPLSGIGSPARDATIEHTLEQFIRADSK